MVTSQHFQFFQKGWKGHLLQSSIDRNGESPNRRTSDNETSSIDLNIKVIGSNVHTSIYDKRHDFEFPIHL